MKPLNPIMAVLVIASVGALPLQTLAADGKETAVVVKEPTSVPVAVEDKDKDSITRLTEVLAKNPQAAADAGQRISDFLLQPDADKKSFVASGVTVKALDGVTRAWVKKQKPGDLAMLYFVVGTGAAAPDWVSKDPLLSKTVMPKRDAEGRLRIALARFTEAGGAQITQKGEKEAATAFLNTASAEAKKVFDDKRPKPAVDASVEQNNNTGVKPPDGTRSAGSQFGGGANQYSLKDLYEDGAVVVNVAGAKDPNSRRISMKIFSKRLENGDIVNEIGIFDITDSPVDTFGQRFAIGGGDQSFVLDDRTPGHKKYELKFGKDKTTGELNVTFKRPGDGGTPLTSTLNNLFIKRADQAAALQNIVKINGEEFYTVPQGGARAALMMFPKGMIDGRGAKGDLMDLGPALYAEVGERGSDGRNQNVKPGKNGGPMLGNVGGKDYKLVFNQKLGIWEVAEGIGDKPVVPVEGKGDGATTSTTTTGGTTTPTPGGGDQDKPEMAIPDLEKLLLLDANCKKYSKDTELMADRLKGKFGMIMCNPTGKAGGDQAILLVPKSMWANQQMVYSTIRANDMATPPTAAAVLKKGRIVDHYLVLEFDTQVQYLDLDKKIEGGFELAGLVANKDVGGPPTNDTTIDRPGMTNMIIFLDALRNYMGIAANSGVFAAVPERVKKELGSKPYDLQARYSKENVLQVFAKGDGPHFQIWPTVKYPPSGTPNTQYEKLGGPANVFEAETSSADAPFEDKFDIPNSYQLQLAAKEAGIALYKAVDPTGKEDPKKYYVSFKYWGFDTANANPASAKDKKVFKQKYFEVFNKDNPLPEKREMLGLLDPKDVQVRGQLAYRFIKGTDTKKGVLAVFQNAQLEGEGQKDGKANCVGPLIWWGISNRTAALKVCKEDKF